MMLLRWIIKAEGNRQALKGSTKVEEAHYRPDLKGDEDLIPIIFIDHSISNMLITSRERKQEERH